MKPDFEAVARNIMERIYRQSVTEARAVIAAQLALAYQEGICEGLRQSEAAIKAAFDKYQGREEP